MFNLKTVPTIYQPGVVPNEIYSGVPSFMGMPTAKTAEELKQYDFAVMGVPFEGGCTYGGFSSCVVAPKTSRSRVMGQYKNSMIQNVLGAAVFLISLVIGINSLTSLF